MNTETDLQRFSSSRRFAKFGLASIGEYCLTCNFCLRIGNCEGWVCIATYPGNPSSTFAGNLSLECAGGSDCTSLQLDDCRPSKYKNTKIQKYKKTYIQKNENTKIQKLKYKNTKQEKNTKKEKQYKNWIIGDHQCCRLNCGLSFVFICVLINFIQWLQPPTLLLLQTPPCTFISATANFISSFSAFFVVFLQLPTLYRAFLFPLLYF